MADKPVFTPVDPQNSPFSAFLAPPAPQQQQVTPISGLMGAGGKTAMLATKFLQGATQGRIAAYAKQQASNVANTQRLEGYINDLPKLGVSPASMDYAVQRYHQALGGAVSNTVDELMGGGEGKGRKGKKQGEQDQQPIHGVLKVIKSIADRATGGPFPEGYHDPGKAWKDIQQYYFDDNGKVKPEFSQENQWSAKSAELQAVQKGIKPGATWDEAAPIVLPKALELMRIDPERGQVMLQSLQKQYPAPRAETAEEAERRKFLESFAAPPQGGQPQAGPPAVAGVPPEVAQFKASQQIGPPGAAPAVAGPPQQGGPPPITPAQLSEARRLNLANVDETASFIDKSGKRVKGAIYEVQTPLGLYKYALDEKGAPYAPDQSKIVKGGVGGSGFTEVEVTRADGKTERVYQSTTDPGEYKDARGDPYILPLGATVKRGRETSSDETRDLAINAYREKHKITGEMTASQTVAALKEYKEATEPGDVAMQKHLTALLTQERLNTIREGEADAKMIAEAIMDGTQPPELTRLYGKAAAVRGELAKAGYDLKGAMLDWQATTRWVNTQNSTQQVRLRQAVDFSVESLDLMTDLSREVSKYVDRSQFPVFNSLAMKAARGGAFGEKAAIAAGNLEIQLKDLQAELALVYKGGSSPTDQGLKQAQDILNSNWDEKRLQEAINLSKKNLQLRLNSIKNTGPISGSSQLTIPPPGGERPKPTKKGDILDRQNGEKYYELAGKDPAKARQMAQEDGWTIPAASKK